MIPPMSSNTRSGKDLGNNNQSSNTNSQNKQTSSTNSNGAGRPKKEDGEKSDKTIANQESSS